MNKICFYIDDTGCHLRSHDAEKIKNYLISNNYKYSEKYNESDIVIIVGCLVVAENLNRTNNIIEKHINNLKKVVLTGCISKEILEKYNDKVIHVPPDKLDKIDTLLDSVKIPFQNFTENFKIFPSDTSKVYINKIKYRFNKTFFKRFYRDVLTGFLFKKEHLEDFNFLKVSTGCVFNCSFCNTRFCFDGVHSKPVENIINEYKELINQKAKNVVFISEDIGSYGVDIKTTFFDLLLTLNEIDKNKKLKWHLDTVMPIWAIKHEEKFEFLTASKRIKSIVYTIESGSSRILKLMNRFNDVKAITENILKIRKSNPLMRISGVFLFGFPSETEEEFMETLHFMKNVQFDDVIISWYSEFEHCQSAAIFPKINDDEREKRYFIAKKFLEKNNIVCKYFAKPIKLGIA